MAFSFLISDGALAKPSALSLLSLPALEVIIITVFAKLTVLP